MSISASEFHDYVDAVQEKIEDILDASDLDIDLENSGGILTIQFNNGSQIILSRQEPLRQLWIAARSGGFHLDYRADEQRWFCANEDQYLDALLSALIQQQGNSLIELPEL